MDIGTVHHWTLQWVDTINFYLTVTGHTGYGRFINESNCRYYIVFFLLYCIVRCRILWQMLLKVKRGRGKTPRKKDEQIRKTPRKKGWTNKENPAKKGWTNKENPAKKDFPIENFSSLELLSIWLYISNIGNIFTVCTFVNFYWGEPGVSYTEYYFSLMCPYGVWLFYPLADCPPHGSSRMVHCSDCPLYGVPTVTNCRQLASTIRRFDHWWSNH